MQVLVLGFDQPAFTGEIVAELSRLREAHVVRLVDVLLVTRVDDTTFETRAVPGDVPEDLGRLAATLLGGPDTAGLDETAVGRASTPPRSARSLADSVPGGSTAAVALIEHLWAVPLCDAIQRAGGVQLDETWLAQGDVALLDSLASGT